MSIRLNKALRELNIGLQTAVEFLEKKSELGEVKPELSFKLSDQQYGALVEAFKQDAEVRNQAEKLFQKKPKEKKRASEAKEARVEKNIEATSTQQKYKPLGKMDLSVFDKKPVAKDAVAQDSKKASASKDEPVKQAAAVSPEPVKQEKPKPVEEQKQEPVVSPEANNEAPKVVEKPAAQADKAEKVSPANPTETTEEQERSEAPKKDGGIFQTKSELEIQNTPKVNVLGKIDLSTINQSTRPKKKTKEERRKEREEKLGGERKKRVRINQERVDINAASKQIGNNGGNANGNKFSGGDGRNANRKNRKNNNNKGHNQKPLEVNEEEVARQVKETLARLTSKGTQNKKGAKYRKERLS